ncbi:amine oxidase [Russula dissimulans]|nr:amine oxidase [Russula dissimulans]
MLAAGFRIVALCTIVASAFKFPEPELALAPLSNNGTGANSLPPKLIKQVLILGGGVSGILAARKLTEEGITDFLIVEARNELGGRMQSSSFGAPGRQVTVEIGANWIQGTQEGNGPSDPILVLARKHNITTVESDFLTSMTTYDETGAVDYLDVFNKSFDAYTNLTSAAGARFPQSLIDLTARTGYSLINQRPKTPHEKAAEYFQFDLEYAQSPEQSSLMTSSWGNNFTYDVNQGGFSTNSLFSIDRHGFKHVIQAEAAEFLKPSQVLFNATVATIAYSDSGVTVTLTDGRKLSAQYSICTFSLGVLQNDDVRFEPVLPTWKTEAIHSMTMVLNMTLQFSVVMQPADVDHYSGQATYTKIFLRFPKKFWFDTQFALYADTERGRYPVWQGLDVNGFFPGSGVIFATVTGDFSERIESLSDDKVKSEALGVLQAMFPNVTIPEPTAFLFPRWSSDSLYRGSYSNWPASFVTRHHTNLRAPLGRLWFAGEALSEKYFGFLHGAYYEGEATGAQVSQCLKGYGCTTRPHITDIHDTAPYDP